MGQLRRWLRLTEEAQPNLRYFMHVTSAQKLPSILKHGLIPNHGGGNYDDFEWVSLDGVYASTEATHLRGYLIAHALSDAFAVLVLAVEPGASLPDEDIVVSTLQHAYDAVCQQTKFNPLDGIMDERRDTTEPGGSFWTKVEREFHALAAQDGAKMDRGFVADLVDWWADFRLGLGNVDPYQWADIKDRAARRYPDIKHPVIGHQHSVRIPQTVGFSGPAHIVAALRVVNATPKLVYGTLPPAAAAMVDALMAHSVPIEDDAETPAQQRQALTALAIARHPERTAAEIVGRIQHLSDADVRQMLPNYRDQALKR